MTVRVLVFEPLAGPLPSIAAAGISVFWALWHLPMYFIEGSHQHGLGFGLAAAAFRSTAAFHRPSAAPFLDSLGRPRQRLS